MFFYSLIGTVKNICNKTLTFKFKRKRILLSEKNKSSKAIGYARATHNEFKNLEEQIKNLKEEGCSLVFSEFISLDAEVKPQLDKAINYLTNSSIFKILYELDNLEDKSLGERKREQLLRRKLSGNNLGGRPKISPLKESLVIRLRNEGYSYRSIRSQTGIALSTIRRVILEGELT